MCPLIPWELVADPLGSAEQTLRTTGLDNIMEGILKISTVQPPALATFSPFRIRQPEETLEKGSPTSLYCKVKVKVKVNVR
jgi:hypothetical protein